MLDLVDVKVVVDGAHDAVAELLVDEFLERVAVDERDLVEPINKRILGDGIGALGFFGQVCRVEATSGPNPRNAVSFLAASAGRLFWPRQADVTKTSEKPVAAAICAQVTPFAALATMIASVISTPLSKLAGCGG